MSDDTTADGQAAEIEDLVERLLDGDHRALARAISKIENRSPGYRDLVRALYAHAGDAEVIGVTGAPGAGKSTLVDKLARRYRDAGLTVGIIAIDPSSPFTGGSVLGDRIRMSSTSGDMETFVRSMSARGALGGLSTATGEAVTALDAFGKDRIVVETVGAGQNEVDVVRTADTVAVLVPPGSGDDVQMLKAGILEIGDVFVVNKADLPGADRTVMELREMLEGRSDHARTRTGHHGPDAVPAGTGESDRNGEDGEWEPRIVETVATGDEGIDELVETLDEHAAFLRSSGRRERLIRRRSAERIRRLLRTEAAELVAREATRHGGVDALAERVSEREVDPYTAADAVLDPLRECVEEHADGG
jgi:LAO/AO transport system kinase